jgi:NAD(P)-dependent dehydrogenase (short-subunit alcohol dehydrogenase family)
MNKVALVTGAAAGIGAAISRRLAKDGVAIGVLDLTTERAH